MRIEREERLLVSCGKVEFGPEDRRACAAALEQPFSQTRFVELAYRHKVLPTVVTHLTELQADAPIPVAGRIVDELRAAYEGRRDWIAAAVVPELVSIAEAFSAAGVAYAFTKGSHLLPVYPEGHLRQLNDVDILVRDVQDLFRAYDVLHALGYCVWFRYENPWLEGAADGGECAIDSAGGAGHIVFTRFLTSDRETCTEEFNRIQVEIYAAGQTAGVGHLESGVWSRLQRDARGFRVPSAEDALLILLAHNVKHGEYFLKDLNDIYLLVSQAGTALDWAYLISTARDNGLDAMGALLFRLVNDYYGRTVIPASVLTELGRSKIGVVITRSSFRLRDSAHVSSATLQAPMIWARRRGHPPLWGLGGTIKELAAFVTGLPLEYQTTRLAGPAAQLWRRLDGRRKPLGVIDGRMYLIPIVGLSGKVLDVDAVLQSGALSAYAHRALLPRLLVHVEGGTCRVVLHKDYVFLPTVIPYKPSRAILGPRVADHIAFARVLMDELDRAGCLRERTSALKWFPSQEPFAAVFA